jgi:hypothetical protein
MSSAKCPLGEDCDLTLAWMMGAEKAKDTIKAQAAEIERLRNNIRAEALDMLHGTPCAQIRWQQDREMLEAVIERLKTAVRVSMGQVSRRQDEVERLRLMVKAAYNEGFKQGMREQTSSHGGIPWHDSRFCAALAQGGDA